MAEEGYKRKLTAILSADVAGYSRLMGDNEAETVKTLTAYRKIMGELIQQRRGRVIDSPGDNILAEFASVVDAVQCAVAAQNEFKARNAELRENRRMEFRIGVNLGDVIEEESRIYGDGVNIAARLEALADPGGICISKTAFDHIESKLPLGYEYLGEQQVKNIAKPVGAYRVLLEPRVTVADVSKKEKTAPLWRRKSIVAGGVAVALLVIAALIWNFYFRPPPIEPASVEKMAFPLPEKPSIAVLPFKNISGDSEQEFLADGITESLIGAISRVSGLFVIASNSVFTYKGKPVKIQTVSQDLGVQNVLEGTVQRSGNRLRIHAQLIDAITGRHVWSEKYDRDMEDIFSVQDSISKEVLTALRVKIVEGEQALVWARGTNNLDAYLKFLQAYDHFKSFNRNSMIRTKQVCKEAINLDAKYEAPYSLLGCAHLIDLWFHWGESPSASIKKSGEALQKAVTLNPLSDYAWANLGHLNLLQGMHDEAVEAGEKSIALNPNGDYNMILLGITFNYVRRWEEAIRLFKEGQRRNPYCPAWYIHNMAYSYLGLERYDEAIAEAKRALDREPDHFPAMVALASLYGNAGKLDLGRGLAEKILRFDPGFSLESVEAWPYKHKSDAEVVMDGLRKVGIPEHPPLPLPDKPSIAVLPFVNMSDDPKQEYFSDGMSEDVITDLSKIPGLLVISRYSSFSYKGKAVKTQKIAEELGVRYLLEGSVRRADDRLRINAQLIDATTGHHLWAERYDGTTHDIFALQDKITRKIVASLALKLTESEQERLEQKETNNIDAYEAFLKGSDLADPEYLDADRYAEAIPWFKKAIELDPNYSRAYAALAETYFCGRHVSLHRKLGLSLRHACVRAYDYLQKARKNPTNIAHRASMWKYVSQWQHEKAVEHAMRAIALNPNDRISLSAAIIALNYAGRSDEAVDILKRMRRVDPACLF